MGYFYSSKVRWFGELTHVVVAETRRKGGFEIKKLHEDPTKARFRVPFFSFPRFLADHLKNSRLRSNPARRGDFSLNC